MPPRGPPLGSVSGHALGTRHRLGLTAWPQAEGDGRGDPVRRSPYPANSLTDHISTLSIPAGPYATRGWIYSPIPRERIPRLEAILPIPFPVRGHHSPGLELAVGTTSL